MRISTKEVRDGMHNGKVVWICHYNQPDLNKRPLRNVPPTKVLVRDNSEANKRIFYSKSHFAKLGKGGKTTSVIISPVDNTGYRSLAGNELFVFDCESECIAEFNKQVDSVIMAVEFEIKTAQQLWINRRDDLFKMKINTKE
jgi:hypothetical protein